MHLLVITVNIDTTEGHFVDQQYIYLNQALINLDIYVNNVGVNLTSNY